MLVPLGHLRAGPPHDRHDRPRRNPEDEQHRRGRMPGIVQAAPLGHRPWRAAPSTGGSRCSCSAAGRSRSRRSSPPRSRAAQLPPARRPAPHGARRRSSTSLPGSPILRRPARDFVLVVRVHALLLAGRTQACDRMCHRSHGDTSDAGSPGVHAGPPGRGPRPPTAARATSPCRSPSASAIAHRALFRARPATFNSRLTSSTSYGSTSSSSSSGGLASAAGLLSGARARTACLNATRAVR